MHLPPTPASHRSSWRGGIFASLLLALAASAPPLRAQDAPPPPPPGAAVLPPLDQLLAPIALYPDPLIGLVLAASTDASDLPAAAAYVAQGGDPGQIAAQPWNDGVKGLAHYPDVLKWMSDNMAWTQQLGAAFASQPSDVMSAVQDLRARARASGALTSTPQQSVVTEGDAIAIEPAQPDEIYVPLYDPAVVYYAQPPGYWGGPFLTFGPAYPMGIWLGFDFDWRGRRLWAGDWYDWRRAHGGWGHPYDPRDHRFAGFTGHARMWSPPPGPRVNFSVSARGSFAAPRPMAGAPVRSAPRGGAAFHPSPAPQVRAEEHQRAPHGEPARAPERAPEHVAPRAPERPAEHVAPRAPERPAEHVAPRAEHAAPAAGHSPASRPAPKAKPPAKRPPPRPEEHKE